MHRRRRPLARPGLGRRPAVLCATAGCGPGGHGVRGPRRCLPLGSRPPGWTRSCWAGSTRTRAGPFWPASWVESAAAGVVARLVEEARGNPLALLELPRELDTAQLTGAAPLPAQLHLTERVEQAFLDRSRRLPEPVQRVVLLAAADDSGRLDVVRDAARRLGLDEHALRGAVDSGLLVQTDDVVALRHPLVRSAIYQAAADDDRRRAHRALADSLSSSGEVDRAVWHRAFAATTVVTTTPTTTSSTRWLTLARGPAGVAGTSPRWRRTSAPQASRPTRRAGRGLCSRPHAARGRADRRNGHVLCSPPLVR